MNRFVRAALLGLAATVSLAAQQLSLGAVSASPGQAGALSVSLASQGSQIAGVEFDLLYNTADLTISAVGGASATAAGKSVFTSRFTNDLRIIIVGVNQSVIPDGGVANLTIQVAANTARETVRSCSPT